MGINSLNVDALTEAPYACALERHGTSSQIVLEGELDLAAKPLLDETIAAALASGPVETVVVDLTRVTFADSTTMTWLVQADTRATEAGGRLIAVAGPGPVLDVLRMTGIAERVALHADGKIR